MSAIFLAITSLAKSGENIVASPYIYGGTFNLFSLTFKKLGIDCRLTSDDSAEAFEARIDQNTRAIFVESMSNPNCRVADIEAIANVARKYDIPFIVDNTFGAGGYLCNPFNWGANIIVDSATKWINGHGTAMGGIIIDKGDYNWGNGKYPEINGPSEGYHGLNLYETFASQAFIIKCRVDGLRDMGSCTSPFDAYLMLIGLETLSLRAQRIIESTDRLARYLQNHPKVDNVKYVGFPENPSYNNAQKYFRNGGAGVISIELKGDLQSTVRFVEGLKLVANMTMVGDSITVVTHPASTTHKQLSDEDKLACGITPTLLRISMGLENVEDIIEDFEQAFTNA
jgi:O-acetylhomoserine (thiol)-lyase